MKPVVAFLRERGLLSSVYLDDFLLIGYSFTDCLHNVNFTIEFLTSLGFVINIFKSNLTPSQSQKYLGFIFNSCDMSLFLPENKRLALLDSLKRFVHLKSCKIRDFASLIGSLISVCKCVVSAIFMANTTTRLYLYFK